MLNTQSLFGVLEQLSNSLLNTQIIVRANRQPQRRKNAVATTRNVGEIERNVSALNISQLLNVNKEISLKTTFFVPTQSLYELPSQILLQHLKSDANFKDALKTSFQHETLHFQVGNLTFLSTKAGKILIQQRGFRTKSYEARMSAAKSAKPLSILDIFDVSKWKAAQADSAFSKTKQDDGALLKNMLGDQPKAEQEKIKVAFAEGFLASENRKVKVSYIYNLIRIGLFVAICYYVLSTILQFRLGTAGASNEVQPEEVSVTFDDVKGIEEAKEEVLQIVEYLKDPEKFTRLGARLPKGVLLVGLPGSGKTLLARAIAGEAQVPFFRTSGSEFEEMLVGLGAKRVRDLFANARARAPCVIFIDEIDSIGSKRSYNALHPYANQTINQLLNEMDGFLSSAGVIVLAATNRRQDLDPALLRPGRFDVEIRVPWPDLKGRVDIFNLYLSKVKVDSDVNVESLAKSTIGFSGADIENMVNQAALKAASDNKQTVNMHYLDMAQDLIKMGPARKTRIPDEQVNLSTAYHEAGHVLVAYFTKDAIPLHRVTIIPRGMSLGHTGFRPDKEMYQQTKSEILAVMDTLMGGRVAEELIYGVDKVTTGAADDLKKATESAESLVKKLGMSEKVGLRYFDDDERMFVVNEYAQSTSELVDSEIKRFLQESYDRAKNILKTNAAAHKRLAEALLQYETLDADEIKEIIENSKAFTKKII